MQHRFLSAPAVGTLNLVSRVNHRGLFLLRSFQFEEMNISNRLRRRRRQRRRCNDSNQTYRLNHFLPPRNTIRDSVRGTCSALLNLCDVDHLTSLHCSMIFIIIHHYRALHHFSTGDDGKKFLNTFRQRSNQYEGGAVGICNNYYY